VRQIAARRSSRFFINCNFFCHKFQTISPRRRSIRFSDSSNEKTLDFITNRMPIGISSENDAPGCYVYRKFRVFPELKLVFRHKKSQSSIAEPNVASPDDKIAVSITHRRRTVTATAVPVKHRRAVFSAKFIDNFFRFIGYFYSGNIFQI